MKMNTTNGTWNVHGINLITSDSIYEETKKAIESGNYDQKNLQLRTGHMGPIIIDPQRREVNFLSF